jgi:acyl-CoA thioester hydrolase
VVASRAVRRLRVGGVMEQRVLRGEELVAAARVTWVSVDGRGRLCPLPPALDVAGLHP